MSDLRVGDRVRVETDDIRQIRGQWGAVDDIDSHDHPYVVKLDAWPLRFRCRREELYAETPADACRLATTRLREAEAVVAQRRAELRAAWVAAIAALPPVAHAGTFDDVVAVLREYLGPVAPFRANPHQEAAWWDWSGKARVGLRRDEEHLYLRVDAPDTSLRTLCHLTGPEAVTTDAAVRRALTWLAERDVFLLETKENP